MISRKRFLSYIIISFAIISANTVIAAEPSVDQQSKPEQLVMWGLDLSNIEPHKSPRKSSVKRVQSRDTRAIKYWEKREYEGLSIELCRGCLRDGKDWIYRVTLTGNQYEVPFGLHIGANRKLVISTLGTPTCSYEKRDVLVYCPDGNVEFYFNGDAVNRIIWRAYED